MTNSPSDHPTFHAWMLIDETDPNRDGTVYTDEQEAIDARDADRSDDVADADWHRNVVPLVAYVAPPEDLEARALAAIEKCVITLVGDIEQSRDFQPFYVPSIATYLMLKNDARKRDSSKEDLELFRTAVREAATTHATLRPPAKKAPPKTSKKTIGKKRGR